MAIGIDATCALKYWISEHASSGQQYTNRSSRKSFWFDLSALPEWAYAPDGRIHLVVTSKKDRLQNIGTANRISQAVTESTLVQIGPGVIVPSPECCFLLLGNSLTVPELAKVGMLLCSNFAVSDTGHIVSRYEAITTRGRLAKFLKRHPNSNGVKTARAALHYVVDGAASPPEIDATLMFCMPRRLGGFGCPLPELNGKIRLDREARDKLGHPNCYADLLWRKQKCIVEYTSREHHEGYDKQVEDEVRRSSLEGMGYNVFFLMSTQLYHGDMLSGFARPVLRMLGVRKTPESLDYCAKQYSLRKMLTFEQSWIIERACRTRHYEEFVAQNRRFSFG